MLKITQATFAVDCFEACQMSQVLAWVVFIMTSSLLDYQAFNHYMIGWWALAMYLAGGAENGINWCHLVIFNFDEAFATSIKASRHTPPSTLIEVLVVLAKPVEKII